MSTQPSARRTCPLCDSRDHRALRLFREVEGRVIRLHGCRTCGGEFLTPLPPWGRLAREYDGYFARRTELCRAPFPRRNMFVALLRRLLGAPSRGLRILELGSGSGDFMSALQTVAPDSYRLAVEMSCEHADRYRGLGCVLVSETVEQFLDGENYRRHGVPAHSFDYVFLFDVLEHLARPGPVLRQVSRLLRPEGRIVLTLPNASSLSRRLMGPLWIQYKLEHLQYPPEDWNTIADAWDLAVERRENFRKTLPLGYLLSVGKNFGPGLLQTLIGGLARAVPPAWHSTPLSLPLGESLVVLKAGQRKAA